MLNFHIATLFPEFFTSPLNAGLMGKAREAGSIAVHFHNPRDFSRNRHRHVDDAPFGGGAGMVMEAGPLLAALRSIEKPGRTLLMSPGGRPFDDALARELALEENLSLVCGRYEGIDERARELFPMEEVSLCDAVLNGGEAAALAIMEAVARLTSGFMGKEESAAADSFANGLLEYPHYTRPAQFEGLAVPPVLLDGNHALIRDWRRQRSLEKTLRSRPDLLESAPLSRKDVDFLATSPRFRLGKNISFCLFHHPVYLENGQTGASSLTNLDIHDIARISRGYGMGPFYILTPLKDQLELLKSILRHWLEEPVAQRRPDRSEALKLVEPVEDIPGLERKACARYGARPTYFMTSASWPKTGKEAPPLSFAEAREICAAGPAIICLGTARGLVTEAIPDAKRLRPLRFLDANHLSVRAAAAILADRIMGDFY